MEEGTEVNLWNVHSSTLMTVAVLKLESCILYLAVSDGDSLSEMELRPQQLEAVNGRDAPFSCMPHINLLRRVH